MINRLPQYCLYSVLSEEQGEPYFYKVALEDQAMAHLRTLKANETLMEQHLGNHGVVIKGDLSRNMIRYPWIPGITIEEGIKTALRESDLDDMMNWFGIYNTLLEGLEHTVCKPTGFYEYLFGHRTVDTSNEYLCLDFAPLDLIPSNIILSEERFFFIDHEWVFKFPIPKDFVKFRGILSMVYGLQHEIKEANNRRSIKAKLFTGLKNRCYIPVKWATLINNLSINKRELFRWNYLFQIKYLKKARHGFIWI